MHSSGPNGRTLLRTVLIMDEASLTTKLTLYELLPLLLYFRHIILAGDPAQRSPYSPSYYVLRSILELMQARVAKKDDFIKHSFLNVQFRMPKDIGEMISKNFYEGRVRNYRENSRVGNLFFFDHNADVQIRADNSRSALEEANEALQIAESFKNKRPQSTVVILALYNAQVEILMKMAEVKKLQDIGFYTVDEFQGNEAEVTIICTTCYGTELPKFACDRRRMCVSLSRAQQRLVVLGSLKLL